MTIRGHVEGGVIVLDDSTKLPEGTVVEVTLIDPAMKKANREALLKFVGIIDDLPPDASANVDRILYGTPPE